MKDMTLVVGALVLVTVLSTAQNSSKSAKDLPKPAAEMEKLTRALAGQWSIKQNFEPREGMPNGALGEGTEVWQPGPGSRSLIEQINTRVNDQEFSGIGIIWWDDQKQGYRVVWCGSANPRGCMLMSELANWEGKQFVIRDESERDGKRIHYREVFSEITADSFTQTIYQGEEDAGLKRRLTIRAVKGAGRATRRKRCERTMQEVLWQESTGDGSFCAGS